MPQRIIDAGDWSRYSRATSRMVSAGMPQIGAISFGAVAGDVLRELRVAAGAIGDERSRRPGPPR